MRNCNVYDDATRRCDSESPRLKICKTSTAATPWSSRAFDEVLEVPHGDWHVHQRHQVEVLLLAGVTEVFEGQLSSARSFWSMRGTRNVVQSIGSSSESGFLTHTEVPQSSSNVRRRKLASMYAEVFLVSEVSWTSPLPYHTVRNDV